ncbi:glycosyltransferase family A protein [uncultured Draconibacterium sp.]|uniref:glycosyltransferase family A protein n=1 Tax=uncultured Draconibacterium sp. TaxID=1573823 RepID=UPI0029C992A2|nr:glycosyltransferase family A protein [uncultured Draconibacterium sp.]
MQFTYSIIIPHRNSFELLQRAVESIPDRNDVQILIIDNSTYKIDFALLNTRKQSVIKLLYSDLSKGAGHARNVGLNDAIGKWVLFLDADDFYNPGAFQKFDKYKESEYDIIYFAGNSVYSDTLKEANRDERYSKLIYNFLEGKKNAEDILRYWHIPPSSKLIKNKLIQDNSITFEEIPASNDMMFSLKSGHYANKIFADSFPAYCLTLKEGSLTQTTNKKNTRSRYLASIRQYKFMVDIGKPEMRFKLMAMVLKSLKFGIKEFAWYINTAQKENVNIFLGMNRWPKVLYRQIHNSVKKRVERTILS